MIVEIEKVRIFLIGLGGFGSVQLLDSITVSDIPDGVMWLGKFAIVVLTIVKLLKKSNKPEK